MLNIQIGAPHIQVFKFPAFYKLYKKNNSKVVHFTIGRPV